MAITLNGTTGIQNVLGSAAAPAESNTTSSNTGVYFPTSTTLGFSTAGTNAVYIDASQNVGIGTSSPNAKVEIFKDGAPASSGNMNTGMVVAAASGSYAINIGANSSGAYTWINSAFQNNSGTASPLAFMTGATERMRISSSGALLVGTTTPYLIDAKILGYNATSGWSAATLVTNYSGDVSQAAVVIGKADNNTTTSQQFVWFYVNTTTASGAIVANGATAAAFAARSDKRLKENIKDLPPQLANIMALRPVEFDYIESIGGGHQIGFIAQEVQTVYSDLVGEDKEGMLMLTDLNKNDARLIKAIQEQQALITSLTDRIAALEAR